MGKTNYKIKNLVMDSNLILGIGALVLALIFVGAMVYFLLPRTNQGLSGLMGSAAGDNRSEEMLASKPGTARPTEEQMQKINRNLAKKTNLKKNEVTEETRFFRAGLFTVEDKATFYKIRLVAPILLSLTLGVVGFIVSDFTTALSGFVLGLLIGAQVPKSYIDRKIKRRNEDIMFYLPLVIEQIVIGVSSSLDTGPCISRVISMADERNSHNPVTELLRHAEQFARSGISFEEAMTDVGSISGHPELKHAFKSLAQVAKYGGEITRQLQELADSVSSQRETAIEGKIKRLELEATGPVGLVFFGFMIIFLSGLGAQVMKAFG